MHPASTIPETISSRKISDTNCIADDPPYKSLRKFKGFKLAHLNIASIPKHPDELNAFMKDKPVDILSLNETRLDDTIDNDNICIPGYVIFKG